MSTKSNFNKQPNKSQTTAADSPQSAPADPKQTIYNLTTVLMTAPAGLPKPEEVIAAAQEQAARPAPESKPKRKTKRQACPVDPDATLPPRPVTPATIALEVLQHAIETGQQVNGFNPAELQAAFDSIRESTGQRRRSGLDLDAARHTAKAGLERLEGEGVEPELIDHARKMLDIHLAYNPRKAEKRIQEWGDNIRFDGGYVHICLYPPVWALIARVLSSTSINEDAPTFHLLEVLGAMFQTAALLGETFNQVRHDPADIVDIHNAVQRAGLGELD